MIIRTTLIATGLIAASLPAAANVLDFGSSSPVPTICASSVDGLGVMDLCGNFGFLNQSYGDIVGVVNVTYSEPRVANASLRWWSTDYNNLDGVAWASGGDNNSQARIEIVAQQAGMGITLTHFDLGAYFNSTLTTTVTITDLTNDGVLFSYSGPVGLHGGGNFATPFDFNLSSTTGIRIEWADSAYNVGIDNITYSVTPVPEAETYALMLAGLGLIAWRVRRRG